MTKMPTHPICRIGARLTAWAAAAALAVLLAGCEDGSAGSRASYPREMIKTDGTPVEISSVPLDPGSVNAGGPAATGINIPPDAVEAEDGEPVGGDKADKIQLYYVLLGMATKGVEGGINLNLEAELNDARALAEGLKDDQHKEKILQIIDVLQEAVDAGKIEEQLKRNHLASASIPWGSGSVSVESRLKTSIGYDPRLNGVVSLDRDRLMRAVLDFENRHHAAPADVKRNAFVQALTMVKTYR
jgi:hypothetical protein